MSSCHYYNSSRPLSGVKFLVWSVTRNNHTVPYAVRPFQQLWSRCFTGQVRYAGSPTDVGAQDCQIGGTDMKSSGVEIDSDGNGLLPKVTPVTEPFRVPAVSNKFVSTKEPLSVYECSGITCCSLAVCNSGLILSNVERVALRNLLRVCRFGGKIVRHRRRAQESNGPPVRVILCCCPSICAM